MTDGIWTEVFVVLDCEWRDGAEVIGVATELETAQRLADHRTYPNEAPHHWGPWKTDSDGFTRRDGMNEDGSIHVSIYQEIVPTKLVGDQIPAVS